MSPTPAPLTVDVWSDFACPWCWIGKRRLETALARLDASERVVVRRRAFELDPTAPRVQEPRVPYAERLARKYATTPASAQEMIDRMTATGAAEGLDMRFDRVRPGNTFDAHRLQRLADELDGDGNGNGNGNGEGDGEGEGEGEGEGDRASASAGLGAALHERLFRAYLSEGVELGDREALVALAAEVGLDAERARTALVSDGWAQEVRADEAEAGSRGVRAVPCFLLGGRTLLSGAQPPDALLHTLRAELRRSDRP